MGGDYTVLLILVVWHMLSHHCSHAYCVVVLHILMLLHLRHSPAELLMLAVVVILWCSTMRMQMLTMTMTMTMKRMMTMMTRMMMRLRMMISFFHSCSTICIVDIVPHSHPRSSIVGHLAALP